MDRIQRPLIARRAVAGTPSARGAAAADRVAIGTCANCHGPQGQSIQPKFPVLAGQRANYLAAQLHAFKDRTRGDPDALGYMWGMAAPLSNDSIAALSQYYSRQAVRRGPRGSAQLAERGKDIYLNGDPARDIPACAACHGPQAEGNDSFPRLAGQHVQYLIKQLRSFHRWVPDPHPAVGEILQAKLIYDLR